MSDIYEELSTIVDVEFLDIVLHSQIFMGKLRLHVIDGSYLDVWFSHKLSGRFAYHWERRKKEGKVYRYDNRPHEKFKHMKSYPKHFHNGSDEQVEESHFSENPKDALREFLNIVREKIKQ
ncbi:MAG: DUF6516 family protein [Candidatus Hydrothermarchaeota archaeon]|nr:DUF6516 family protein [Candidatus Hydrothermarchaeota archaeon]